MPDAKRGQNVRKNAKRNYKAGQKTAGARKSASRTGAKLKKLGKVSDAAASGSSKTHKKVGRQAEKAKVRAVRTHARKTIKKGIRKRAASSGKTVSNKQVRGRARRQTKAMMKKD